MLIRNEESFATIPTSEDCHFKALELICVTGCRNMFFLLVQFPYCQFETAGCGYGR